MTYCIVTNVVHNFDIQYFNVQDPMGEYLLPVMLAGKCEWI